MAYSADGDFNDDDLHLAPSSLLIDAGDPATTDTDGSRSDLGAFGGEQADRSYYQDVDQDGIYDGWEAAHGLDATKDDAKADPDADSASNLEEFFAASDPMRPDSDEDGLPDGTELSAGSSPTDWYSQAGIEGSEIARVPGDFATIQAAVDAVAGEGTIEVDPGTWNESLRLELKEVTLTGTAGLEATVLQGMGGSVVAVAQAAVQLRGFTLTGGDATNGGGLFLSCADGELSDLRVTGNIADSGGGIALSRSSARLSDCEVSDNMASGRNANGGGLHLQDSSPSLTHCVVSGNSAEDGGGVYVWDSSPALENCRIVGNTADFGGGMLSYESGPTLTHCVLVGNSADYDGGGLYTYSSSLTPRATSSILAYNTGYNVYVNPYSPRSIALTYSDLYAPSGQYNYTTYSVSLDPTNVTVEPGFLEYGADGLPSDLHLALDSALVDGGDPSYTDVDGSRSDPGTYGGAEGGGWDRDDDGYFDWFWPGTIDEAPAGIDAAGYDCDDLERSVAAECM